MRTYHRRVRPFRRWWLVVPFLLAFYLAANIYLPYYSLGPGPARAVQPLIRFDEHARYESQGAFVLTSVRFRQLTALGVVQAWLDPALTVVGRDVLYAPGETDEQEQQRSISQMDQSKLDAAYVVLDELTGYPEEHGDGVLVEGVVAGCAAEGELFVGDLIREIDGGPVQDLAEARRAIRAAASGDRLTFAVTVDGEPETVRLVREPCGAQQEPLVGISMIEAFPFELTISSEGISGPSAGLAWGLGLYDLLTAGDLTDGRTIAVTGVLGPDGTVYPIGGIEEKVAAAASAKASVLIVPAENLAAARSAGETDLQLVPVATFEDALAFLRGAA